MEKQNTSIEINPQKKLKKNCYDCRRSLWVPGGMRSYIECQKTGTEVKCSDYCDDYTDYL